jgi:selenocysteine lyase/cysteine desulfurase
MSPVDSATIKQRFPALAARPEVAYLDSASTTQKPASVVAAVQRYLTDGTANAGRGTYPWANRITREVDDVRERVGRFVGAAGPDEIVFTAGATASLNAVALFWGWRIWPTATRSSTTRSTTRPTSSRGVTCSRSSPAGVARFG